MATPIAVEDPLDPRLADFFGLTDATLRRRTEAQERIFIAEGITAIRRLLASSHPVRAILITPSKLSQLEIDVSGCSVFVAELDLLKRVVGFGLHRGAVASGDRLSPRSVAEVLSGSERLAILEGINDFENLGSIFRSASALGIDGVLLDPTCADPYYRRCVRVSMGEVLHVPFARLPSWPEFLGDVKAQGFELIGLSPKAAQPIGTSTTSRPSAVLLGAEGSGLSSAAASRCDRMVRIPMRSGPDSLNVGAAAAIAFHWLRTNDEEIGRSGLAGGSTP